MAIRVIVFLSCINRDSFADQCKINIFLLLIYVFSTGVIFFGDGQACKEGIYKSGLVIQVLN